MHPAQPAEPQHSEPAPVTEFERRAAAFVFVTITLILCDLILAGIFKLMPWMLSQFLGILQQLAANHTLRPTDLITGARAGIVGLLLADFLLLALHMARAAGKAGLFPGRSLWWWTAARAALGIFLCGLAALALRFAHISAALSSEETVYVLLCFLVLATAISALRQLPVEAAPVQKEAA